MDSDAKNKDKVAWWLTAVLVAIIVLWRIPFLNKGIDYTDTGFSLTNYRNVFGGQGIDGIGLFMTTLVGGVIYQVLPGGHLLVFRILHWLFGLASLYLAYRIFRIYLKQSHLLLVLLVLFLGSKGGEALFNYYALTTFFLLLSILLLRNGLTQERSGLLFGAGVVAGINIFVRLPNVLLVGIGLGILFYGRWIGFPKRKVLKYSGCFLAGVIIGVFSDFLCMMSFLSPQKMVQSFMRYVSMAFGKSAVTTPNFLGVEETTDAHSIRILIRVLGMQTLRAILWGLAYLLPALTCFVLWRKISLRSSHIKKSVWGTGIGWGVVFLLCLGWFVLAWRLGGRNVIPLLYLCALGCCLAGLWFCGKRQPEYSFLYSIALLLAPCAIFGSDLGWYRLGLMQYYLVPLMLLSLDNWDGFCSFGSISKAGEHAILWLQQGVVFAMLSGVLFFQLSQLPQTYMDARYCQLDHPVARCGGVFAGMRTSARRAGQLEEYQQLMEREELQGRTVAIFGYFPLGHVLGEQENYFTPPCVDYPSIKVQMLLHQIRQHQDNGDELPVVVISHVNQLQRRDDHYTSPAKMTLIHYLLAMAKYGLFHESENFLVYVPQEDRAALEM